MAETTDGQLGVMVSPENARAAADVMRQVGGKLILSGMNWNDRANRTQPDSWYLAHVDTLISVVGVRDAL